MKRFTKILTTALATLAFACIPALSANVADTTVTAYAASYHTTTPTGYTKASDVNYKTAGGYTVNWGARGEDCTFLSSRAVNFYTGNNTFATLSQKGGGTSQSNAPQSALYKALQAFMKEKHTYQNNYNANNTLLAYTDCVYGSNKISSFYSGKEIGPEWDSAATWNKEHTWPNSKGMGGYDEHDVMMIRPTWVQENSSRGNTAYGESSGYFDPNCEGANVRGDCARIVLYVYTRWGNTSSMWGTGGVMESKDVLLKWMQEDPVDTWEMGRNDAVQSITGTRNVFVDYPEFAWLLFGESIPTGFNTPSGIANGGSVIPPAIDPDLPDTPDTPDVPELP
ncbi:MAG: endonuclease, partial [Clostridia bacterium]|nr:endonuclease [Clostridia bacterium]